MAVASVPVGDWLDLVVTFSMTANQQYRFQNVGGGESPITIVFSQNKPVNSDSGFVYEKGEPVALETLVYDGTVKIWAKAQRTESKIAVRGVE